MKSICVYCGSSPGARPSYSEAAAELGRSLARRGLRLVYGGARVGLMGALADAALAEGGQVVGVMTRFLASKDVAHEGLSELKLVETMGERKELMGALADGFVALPGGLGTLDELFETLVQAQLGLQPKPCALLDVEDYWVGLGSFLDTLVRERFMRSEHRDMVIVDDDVERALDRLQGWTTPVVDKWVADRPGR